MCLARKIEWDDVSLAKAIRSLQQVIKIDAESRVQVHSLPRYPHGLLSPKCPSPV